MCRWGSYPEYLQECSAFQSIFAIAKKNYAAFQLATTERMKRHDGFFTAPGVMQATCMSAPACLPTVSAVRQLIRTTGLRSGTCARVRTPLGQALSHTC